jgi:hypothetical protein
MLSFTKIITLSAMALGTLTQAVPLLQRNPSSAPVTDVVSRRDAPKTIQGVFDGLVDKLNKELLDLSMTVYSLTYSVSLISRQTRPQKTR